jgi:hypothetical protein
VDGVTFRIPLSPTVNGCTGSTPFLTIFFVTKGHEFLMAVRAVFDNAHLALLLLMMAGVRSRRKQL